MDEAAKPGTLLVLRDRITTLWCDVDENGLVDRRGPFIEPLSVLMVLYCIGKNVRVMTMHGVHWIQCEALVKFDIIKDIK